ncbi:hypothetical protein SAMN02927923_04351 [Microvirga guangxiensis]|uniref:Uncharacterized protein n=1 Tax=Microvirga guangxiensis TaxID=549386 RepID=A0A1G5LHZ7_9HYPH|nr:hypothetical protein SAMN02927923_04351 [Microvirga guangxiensis]
MPSAQQLAPARPYMRDCTYNLFRNKQRPELICAVPEDRPVPSFLGSRQWIFERHLQPLDTAVPGFEDHAANVGVRFNGFYLFHLTGLPREMAA